MSNKTQKPKHPSADELAVNNLPSLVVLPSGFVYVGYTTIHAEEGLVSVNYCKNVRSWGTDKGLGQLAVEGKQSDTTLDDVGTLLAPYPSQVLQVIPLSEGATASFNMVKQAADKE